MSTTAWAASSALEGAGLGLQLSGTGAEGSGLRSIMTVSRSVPETPSTRQ